VQQPRIAPLLQYLVGAAVARSSPRFLDRPDVLDAAGGTDIFQMPTSCVKFLAGTDALRCLRFSDRLLRWYSECCKTPIGNTAAGGRFPVVGVIHSFMCHDADGRSRDEALGAPRCGIFQDSAVGPLEQHYGDSALN